MELKDVPVCNSCKRPIMSIGGVQFTCPACGQAIIYRCNDCRTKGVPYKCPVCGFEGP